MGIDRKKRGGSLAVFALFGFTSLQAQQPSPAPPQSKSILVTGGTVHTGDGRVIDEGAVGFRNGRIDYVGYGYGVTATYDTVISVGGQHVYPGFIAPNSVLGLMEIELVRASVDRARSEERRVGK